MDKKMGAIIAIILIILASIGLYVALTPSYKTIEMSGYTLEVPQSNSEVVENTENYNSYDDSSNNLSIKTWAWKNVKDTNTSGCYDIGAQLGSNLGQNVTYENITLFNSTGTYTYFDYDVLKGSMIVITSNDLDAITHIIKTMQKSQIVPNMDLTDFTNLGMSLSSQNTQNIQNSTNINADISSSATKKTKSTSNSKKSSSSSNTINGEKIVERHDLAGDPDYEYLGTNDNIYIKNKKTGHTVKRYLDEDEGVYYYK